MRERVTTILEAVGLGAVAVGCGMVAVPLGLIVGGLMLVGVSVLQARR